MRKHILCVYFVCLHVVCKLYVTGAEYETIQTNNTEATPSNPVYEEVVDQAYENIPPALT